MVVGSGLLAHGFANYSKNNDIVVFCSGVSNSQCTDILEFKRELNLLEDHIRNNTNSRIIYFSTCSIYDTSLSQSKYVQHKMKMEKFIETNCNSFNIFRLSNVVGATSNMHTIFNYFYYCIKSQTEFEVWKNSYRNLIDIQDVVKVVSYIVDNNLFVNRIVNVANTESYSVLQIIHEIERKLKILGHYRLVEKGERFNIDCGEINSIIKALGIEFGPNYLNILLSKYY